MKIVTVIGARPQFIKASVVSRAVRQQPGLSELLVHTGQHYDEQMSQVFFNELDIPRPDYHLEIGSGQHGDQTGRMLAAVERVLLDERPDWVLVYGDTNSTLAGALAAVKLHIPVAHVEAGLRSYNRRMPEEINRVLTDHAADLLLTPTQSAAQLLEREGIEPRRVQYVGDVMYDVARSFGERATRTSRVLESVGVSPGEFVLATVHRPDNTDQPQRLSVILAGLQRLAESAPVVMPVHPRTRKAMTALGFVAQGQLRLIEPVGYLDMAMLEQNARLIATDSGGVQKEAYFYGVPCLTLRGETEWTELVEHGGQQLHIPDDEPAFFDALHQMLAQPRHTPNVSLFGDGHAAEKIVAALQSFTP